MLLCPECQTNNVQLTENSTNKKGLASNLVLQCVCGFQKLFYTSKNVNKTFEVNKRMVYSMRSCGQGYAGLEKFTFCMNLPKPMTKMNYIALSNVI